MSDTGRPYSSSGRTPEELFAKVPGFVRDDVHGDLEKGRVFRALFGEAETQSKISRFRVLEHIGAGGMARVFAAYDEQLDRKVAIKMVRPRDAASARSNERLLREAQTLAQLSHPNIVQVYEAGRHRDAVYIAMEFVRGKTLSQWLEAQQELPRRRRWRRVLELFFSAGRGLEAAHQAGLVHRDFKPDNVLVGDDGRVRVADFGLARVVSAQQDASDSLALHSDAMPSTMPRAVSGVLPAKGAAGDAADDSADASTFPRPRDNPGAVVAFAPDTKGGGGEAHDNADPLGVTEISDREAETPGKVARRLTATGTFMGTPRFMSPEQMLGGEIDHRSDQFSFCVSLFYALYGEWPFEGDDPSARMESIRGARIATPRGPSDLPSSVRRAILRGLRAEPDARFADMGELLGALDSWRLRRRRAVLGVAVVALLGAGASTFAAVAEPPDPCAEVGAKVAALWTPERQRHLAQVFDNSGIPYADVVWSNTAKILDGYAERWRQSAQAACEDPLRRDSSVHRLCLADGVQRLDALLTTLERSKGETLGAAINASVAAATALPEPAECDKADVFSLGMEQPARDEQDEVRELRKRLSFVETRELLGDYRGAEADLDAMRSDIESVSYEPVRGEYLHHLGHILARSGGRERIARAQQVFFEALDISEGTRHERLSTVLWYELVNLAEQNHGNMEQGFAWARRLQAAVRRAGDPTRMRARTHHALGRLHMRSGAYAAAESEIHRAIELHRAVNPDAVYIAHYYHDLAANQRLRGEYLEARELFEKALAMETAQYGPGHPQVARVQIDFGQMLVERGEIAPARDAFTSALDVWTKNLGENNYQVAVIHINLAEIEASVGNIEIAREHAQRVFDTVRKIAVSGEHLHAEALMIFGIVERYAHNWQDALEAFETALRIRREHFKSTQQEPLWAALYLSDVLGHMGRFEQARAHCDSLRESIENTTTPPSLRAMMSTACGRAYQGLGHHSVALASFERAAQLFREFAGLSWEKANAYGALALALTHTDELPRERACALAREARSLFADSAEAVASMREQLDELGARCNTRP
ncbi:serine/threonine-protein kinase [Haliangium ochraceum]|uniref:Serine/threonine protein kinase n=1 Tax=Haliangium ochraceum (strain DSM 14365 / JCM 11303 / SMP-2) TaxID=502025 RepID=D0LVS2_HALO1|nr:serine/threonine-protein kinase [Haliangium ochraceum]ACY14056.1 serine/threonine protein kinase [Haliangium ochraceum DSM 14365]